MNPWKATLRITRNFSLLVAASAICGKERVSSVCVGRAGQGNSWVHPQRVWDLAVRCYRLQVAIEAGWPLPACAARQRAALHSRGCCCLSLLGRKTSGFWSPDSVDSGQRAVRFLDHPGPWFQGSNCGTLCEAWTDRPLALGARSLGLDFHVCVCHRLMARTALPLLWEPPV